VKSLGARAADLVFQARARWFPWDPPRRLRVALAIVGFTWAFTMLMSGLFVAGAHAGIVAQANGDDVPELGAGMVASVLANVIVGVLLMLLMPARGCACCGQPRRAHVGHRSESP